MLEYDDIELNLDDVIIENELIEIDNVNFGCCDEQLNDIAMLFEYDDIPLAQQTNNDFIFQEEFFNDMVEPLPRLDEIDLYNDCGNDYNFYQNICFNSESIPLNQNQLIKDADDENNLEALNDFFINNSHLLAELALLLLIMKLTY